MEFIYADSINKPKQEHCLAESDLEFARNNTVDCGTPVVFLADGQPVDIVTGQIQPANTPEAERICYFNFDQNIAQAIAKATRTVPHFLAQSN